MDKCYSITQEVLSHCLWAVADFLLCCPSYCHSSQTACLDVSCVPVLLSHAQNGGNGKGLQHRQADKHMFCQKGRGVLKKTFPSHSKTLRTGMLFFIKPLSLLYWDCGNLHLNQIIQIILNTAFSWQSSALQSFQVDLNYKRILD